MTQICGDSNTTGFDKSVVFGSSTAYFGEIPQIFSGLFGQRVVLEPTKIGKSAQNQDVLGTI